MKRQVLDEVNGSSVPYKVQDPENQQKIRVFVNKEDWELLRVRTVVSKEEFTVYGEIEMLSIPGEVYHDIRIKRLLPWVPEQVNSCSSTLIEGDKRKEIFDAEDPEKDRFSPKNYRNDSKFGLWIHSHGTHNTFWSSTDEKCVANWGSSKFLVSIVINNKMEFKIRYDMLDPLRFTIEKDIDLFFEEVEADSLVLDQVKKEMKATEDWIAEQRKIKREAEDKARAANISKYYTGNHHGYQANKSKSKHRNHRDHSDQPNWYRDQYGVYDEWDEAYTWQTDLEEHQSNNHSIVDPCQHPNNPDMVWSKLTNEWVTKTLYDFQVKHSRWSVTSKKMVDFLVWWGALSKEAQDTNEHAYENYEKACLEFLEARAIEQKTIDDNVKEKADKRANTPEEQTLPLSDEDALAVASKKEGTPALPKTPEELIAVAHEALDNMDNKVVTQTGSVKTTQTGSTTTETVTPTPNPGFKFKDPSKATSPVALIDEGESHSMVAEEMMFDLEETFQFLQEWEVDYPKGKKGIKRLADIFIETAKNRTEYTDITCVAKTCYIYNDIEHALDSLGECVNQAPTKSYTKFCEHVRDWVVEYFSETSKVGKYPLIPIKMYSLISTLIETDLEEFIQWDCKASIDAYYVESIQTRLIQAEVDNGDYEEWLMGNKWGMGQHAFYGADETLPLPEELEQLTAGATL